MATNKIQYLTATRTNSGTFEWFMIIDHERKQAWLLWPNEDAAFRAYHHLYQGWSASYGINPTVYGQTVHPQKKCGFLKELRSRAPNVKVPT